MRTFILAFLFAATTVHAGTVDPAAVDRIVTTTMKAWNIPGASVAIVEDDHVVVVKGYGVKEVGKADPITPDTLFQIGSTTKAFTSTAMAMAVDDRKMGWDDPVRKHLPAFHLSDPCADSMVTLRDIVSHRTGLSRHDELWDNTDLTRADLIRSIGLVALSKPFRAAYQYQNIMFTSAGEAVAAAEGTTWNEFVRTRIFEPLGMMKTRTTVAEWNASNHALGYNYDWHTGQVQPHTLADDDNLGAAGVIMSSARDMAQWLRFQLADGSIDGHRLVSSDSLTETKTPQTLIRFDGTTREAHPESNMLAYAMGWNVQDYRGTLMVAHNGALNGFRAGVLLLPAKHAGVVVLINTGRGFAVSALRNALADLLLHVSNPRDWSSYYAAMDRRSDEKDEQAKHERDAKRQPDTKPSHALPAYAGTYHNDAYGDVIITVDDAALRLKWQRLSTLLTHFHYDTFSAISPADDVDEQVLFTLAPDGTVVALTFYGERFARKPL